MFQCENYLPRGYCTYQFSVISKTMHICPTAVDRALKFGVCQRVRFLVEWGLEGSGDVFPGKLLKFALLKSLEMNQFLKDGHLGLL